MNAMKTFSLVFVVAFCLGAGASDPRSAIIDNLLAKYDKRFPPDGGEKPIEIAVSMYFLSLTESGPNEFTADFYLRQTWTDPRLSFDEAGIDEIIVSGGSQPFWEPDTFIVNEIKSEVHGHPSKNQLLRLKSSGEILLSRRLSTAFHCDVDSHDFPWGSFSCNLQLESFSHNSKDVTYIWKNGRQSIGFAENLHLSHLRFAGHNNFEKNIEVETGSYSYLELVMQLERLSAYALLVYLVPIMMFTITSFASFWIRGDQDGGAKIFVAFGCLIMCSLLARFLNTEAPQTDYTKACDVFSGLCVIVVFGVLIANVFVMNQGEKGGALSRFIEQKRVLMMLCPVSFVLVLVATCIFVGVA